MFWRVTCAKDELWDDVEAREGVLSIDTAMVHVECSLLSSEGRNFAVELNKEGAGMRPETIEPYRRGSRLACADQFPAPIEETEMFQAQWAGVHRMRAVSGCGGGQQACWQQRG